MKWVMDWNNERFYLFFDKISKQIHCNYCHSFDRYAMTLVIKYEIGRWLTIASLGSEDIIQYNNHKMYENDSGLIVRIRSGAERISGAELDTLFENVFIVFVQYLNSYL